MSVMPDLDACAAGYEKNVRLISSADYEAQKLWREVALILTNDTSYELCTVISFADSVAQAYIKFVNNSENK
jgi:hypothetical protein